MRPLLFNLLFGLHILIVICMSIAKYIPNSITSMNLLCGVLATAAALTAEDDLRLPAVLIIAGAVFDFFDGFVARTLHVSSAIGKELDSLADNISFGLAPAAMYSAYVRHYLTGAYATPLSQMSTADAALSLAPLILAVFAGLRLAKFNIDTRQSENFLGLTTTATGLFTASLLWMQPDFPDLFHQFLSPAVVIVMVAVFSALLVSEIPMFSLKVKHWQLAGNELRLALLVVGLVSLILMGFGGLSVTIALYTLFSIVKSICSKE